MKSRLDEDARKAMFQLLHCLNDSERSATSIDLMFLENDFWLSNAAVIQFFRKQKGGTELSLVFVWHSHPLRLVVRRIEWYGSEQKAHLHGSLMARLAAKDQRGSLQISPSSFNFCYN